MDVASGRSVRPRAIIKYSAGVLFAHVAQNGDSTAWLAYTKPLTQTYREVKIQRCALSHNRLLPLTPSSRKLRDGGRREGQVLYIYAEQMAAMQMECEIILLTVSTCVYR